MRVLLVNLPALSEASRHHYLQKTNALSRVLRPAPQMSVMPSYSLLYLAPGLKQAGHDVEYLEGYFHGDEEIEGHIAERRPDLVATSVYTANWGRCCRVLEAAKRSAPGSRTVAGGIHVTTGMETVLSECESLDFAVYGEGEETVVDLANAVAGGTDLHRVEGILFRDGERIVRNSPRPVVDDLDRLPLPDRDLIEVAAYRPTPLFHKRRPHGSVFGARGCPYKCIFCHTDRRVRYRSPGSLLDELELLSKRYGVRDVSVWDDTFTISPARVEAICEGILERDLPIIWSVNGRVDTVTDGMLAAMKKAGCWRILWGIESGVQKNLDTLEKGIALHQVRSAISKTRAHGIESLGMFVFGIPGETYEEGLETIDFARSLDLDLTSFGFLTPYPGTELHHLVSRGGVGHVKEDGRYDIMNVTFVPSTMTEEELTRLERLAFSKLYLRWSYIARRLLAIRSLEDLRTHLRGFFNLIVMKR